MYTIRHWPAAFNMTNSKFQQLQASLKRRLFQFCLKSCDIVNHSHFVRNLIHAIVPLKFISATGREEGGEGGATSKPSDLCERSCSGWGSDDVGTCVSVVCARLLQLTAAFIMRQFIVDAVGDSRRRILSWLESKEPDIKPIMATRQTEVCRTLCRASVTASRSSYNSIVTKL